MTATGSSRRHLPARSRALWWWIIPVAVAGAIGAALPVDPIVSMVTVVGLVGLAGLARSGLIAPVEGLLALLPWMVLFDSLIPALLRTFVTAAAALTLLVIVWPPHLRRPATMIAAGVFVVLLLAQGVYATDSDQLIQLAKDLIFPAMTIVVLSQKGRRMLPGARRLLVASGLAAMTVQCVIIAAGLGAIGTYYGTGERLGYAPAIPHELALLGVIVAAAGLVSARRVLTQIAFFAVGAVPAAMTGVRSALLAIIVILVIVLIQSRLRPRTLAMLAGVAVLAFASGAVGTVTDRFARQRGEFSSASTIGSGRGEIYTTALSHWSTEGPVSWVFGSGLRSVGQFELEDLGQSFVGHSDVIEITVDLGVIGLVAWLTLWFSLLTGGLRSIILVPVLVYAFVNGSIEYVAPLSYGLVLAAACAAPGLPSDRSQLPMARVAWRPRERWRTRALSPLGASSPDSSDAGP